MPKDPQIIRQFESAHRKRAQKFKKNRRQRLIKTIFYNILVLLHRTVEIILSLFFLAIFTFPAFLLLLIRRLRGKKIFEQRKVFGIGAEPLTLYEFNVRSPFVRNLPLFLWVFTGDLQITGTSIKSYSSRERVTGDAYLFNFKPGIFNLWFIRESSRIGHEGKLATEWEYLVRSRPFADFLLILKSIPAYLFHQETETYNRYLDIFGIRMLNLTMKEAITLLDQRLNEPEIRPVCFVNPDCLNKTFKDKEYLKILQNSHDIFPDGIGIHIASKMLGNPLKENVNGTDMLPFLCEYAAQTGKKMFLLGAKPGVPEKMRDNLMSKYPGLKITGIHHGYFDHNTESGKIIDLIRKSGADILLVAFGVPVQEKWIVNHMPELSPGLVMGVGGLFDFYSGNMPRAPKWMREIGMEWLFRLLMEPKRMWKRYIIGNPVFIMRVLRWKLQTHE